MPAIWWRGAAIYELYVQSFADGDGDGIGDLAGVRARLPYLAGLGVGFWKAGLDASATTKDRRFEPRMPESEARLLRNRWNEAVTRSKNWELAA